MSGVPVARIGRWHDWRVLRLITYALTVWHDTAKQMRRYLITAPNHLAAADSIATQLGVSRGAVLSWEIAQPGDLRPQQ